MISFLDLGKRGRLGNQLFQYAFLRSVAIKTGRDWSLPILKNQTDDGQACLLEAFCLKGEQRVWKRLDFRHHYQEGPFQNYFFDRKVFEMPDETNFSGYFNNFRYFSDVWTEIADEFRLKKDLEEKIQETFREATTSLKNKRIVGVHLRLGDNLHQANKFIVPSKQAIDRALRYFHPESHALLVFCGGGRKEADNAADLLLAKQYLSSWKGDVLYSQNHPTLLDFGLLRSCDDFILTNGTFGWWAAWLSASKDKKVVAQRYWMCDVDRPEQDQIHPDTWISLDNRESIYRLTPRGTAS